MPRHAKRTCSECGREIYVVWEYTLVEGDRVIYGKYSGTEIEHAGEKLLIAYRVFPMHENEAGQWCKNSNRRAPMKPNAGRGA